MGLLDGLIAGTSTLCRWGGRFSGGLLLLASLAVAYDVILRAVLGHSIVGLDEMTGFALAAATAWGFALALLDRAHIRIDTIQIALRARARAVLDIVSLIAIGGIVGIIGWYALKVVARSVEVGATPRMLDLPMWIPQTIWVAGFVTFMALAILLLFRALMAFVVGDLVKLHALIGSRSVTEDVEIEKVQAKRRQGVAP